METIRLMKRRAILLLPAAAEPCGDLPGVDFEAGFDDNADTLAVTPAS